MKSITRFTPEFLLIIYLLLFLYLRHPSDNWDRVINSDGKGYYGYLTAVFIYHDLDYKFIESYEDKYYPSNRSVFKEFRVKVDGRTVNKCFPGIAFLWLPFFLIAHFLSWLFGFATDGYSMIYQYSIAFAALFYFWLACRILLKLLVSSGATIRTAAFITALIALGTNLPFFTVIESSMSHVYTFFLITFFIYAVTRFFQSLHQKWIIPGILSFGLIILSRPTNGLVIMLVPAMASKSHAFPLSGWLKRAEIVRNILLGAVIVAAFFVLPMWMWHHQTGKWIVYSYGTESFNLADPHFLGILFSYNRGWFVYTPLAFLSLGGSFGLWKQDRSRSLWIGGFLVIFIYILSSWWMWYYASKFGQRVFIDIYAVVAILLFYLLSSLRTRILRIIGFVVMVLLTGLNLLQFYQHARFVFPAHYITRDIYWDSFFSLYPKARVFLPSGSIRSQKTYLNDMGNAADGGSVVTSDKAFSGTKISRIDEDNIYSSGIVQKTDSNFSTLNRIISVSAMVFPEKVKSASSLVIDFVADGRSICYNAFFFATNARPDHWTKLEFALYVPGRLPENAIVKIYFYHKKGSGTLLIDDVRADFLSLYDNYENRHIEGISVSK